MDDWKDDKTFIIIDLEQLDAEEPESETGDEESDSNQNNLEEENNYGRIFKK